MQIELIADAELVVAAEWIIIGIKTWRFVFHRRKGTLDDLSSQHMLYD